MTNDRGETAYDFVRQVEQNLHDLGLEETQISLDVDMYAENNTVTFNYKIETMGWVEEVLGGESVSYKDSYSFTSDEDLVMDKELVRELLSDNFLEAALRLDDEIIRESLSPSYDAF